METNKTETFADLCAAFESTLPSNPTTENLQGHPFMGALRELIAALPLTSASSNILTLAKKSLPAACEEFAATVLAAQKAAITAKVAVVKEAWKSLPGGIRTESMLAAMLAHEGLTDPTPTTPKATGVKGTTKCSECGRTGHNLRTCPDKVATATAPSCLVRKPANGGAHTTT